MFMLLFWRNGAFLFPFMYLCVLVYLLLFNVDVKCKEKTDTFLYKLYFHVSSREHIVSEAQHSLKQHFTGLGTFCKQTRQTLDI